MNLMTKEELFQQFKRENAPIFRILGITQSVSFALMALGLVASFWLNIWLLLKIEASLLVLACLIAMVYTYLDKVVRKTFDEVIRNNKIEL